MSQLGFLELKQITFLRHVCFLTNVDLWILERLKSLYIFQGKAHTELLACNNVNVGASYQLNFFKRY